MSVSMESKGPIGLKNLGNTCYMNSVLQCLSRIEGVRAYCSENPYCSGEITDKFSKIVLMLHSSYMNEDLLKDFKATIGKHNETFKGNSQEDSHEFLLFLLGCLLDEVTEANSSRNLPSYSVFCRSQLTSQELQKIICLKCGNSVQYYEDPTPVLSVPLSNSRYPTLEECLNHHRNNLVENNRCIKCGVSPGQQTSTFATTPTTFIFHLKRFCFKDNRVFKDTRSVACPLQLIINEAEAPYELVGCIVHYGGLNRGHYIAFNKFMDKWYKFDDDVVSEVLWENVESTNAYILFYTQKDTRKDTPQCDMLPGRVPSESPSSAPNRAGRKRLLSQGDDKQDITPGNSNEPIPLPQNAPMEEEKAEELLNNFDSANVISLLESDGVPGAALDHSKLPSFLTHQLKRWLACRQLRVTGNKDELLKRIRNHIAAGQSQYLWPGIDGGKWLEMKRKGILTRVGEEVVEEPILPIVGWRIFPGYNIPRTFNEGHVYHFLVESIPRLSEITGKTLRTSFGDDVVTAAGTDKIYRRAQRLVDSDYVENVRDNLQSPRYFVKAYVRASMESKKYFVLVVLSPVSGAILYSKCDECKASALGRCSHVAALLRYMVEHVENHGHDAITSTGRQRQWGKDKTQRDPGPTVQARYYKKKNVKAREEFDPRATEHKTFSYSPQETNDLLVVMQRAVLQQITRGDKLIKPQAWQDSLQFEYDDFQASEEDADIIMEQTLQFCSNLYDNVPTDPYLFPGTDEQSGSITWHLARSLLFTASIAKKVISLSYVQSKQRFLQEHLWGIIKFEGSKETRYGQQSEDSARECYIQSLISEGLNSTVKQTGLWVSKDYPMLGCSPDGVVYTGTDPPKLLEIKCPYTLRNVDPSDFHTHLSKQQLRNFPLFICENGLVCVKKTHAHYHQMQMQMGIMKIRQCDYFVWSKHGFVTVTVDYDEQFWYKKREDLRLLYYRLYVPEYFLMRTPRGLLPMELQPKNSEE